MSEHIVPEWDVEKGAFISASATLKGLGGIEGATRAEFEKAVNDRLPPGTKVIIEYPDKPVELVCKAA